SPTSRDRSNGRFLTSPARVPDSDAPWRVACSPSARRRNRSPFSRRTRVRRFAKKDILVAALALVACGPPLLTTAPRPVASSPFPQAQPTQPSSPQGPQQSTTPTGQATASVLISDDPFPFPILSAASVTIARVELVGDAGAQVIGDWPTAPGFFEI